MATYRKALSLTVLAAGMAMALSGCKFFDISNPLIPKARLFAQPEPSMATVKYTYKQTDNTITWEAKESDIKVSTYPGDGTPGVFIHSYSAEYLDQAGKPIPTITLTKVSFGISQYLPPANNGKSTDIKLQMPVYNQQVVLYGEDQVFSFAGGVQLNRSLIHTINCRVTLYGEDDNFNEVEVPLNVPIRFDGQITQ
jgi:hypothetical protein